MLRGSAARRCRAWPAVAAPRSGLVTAPSHRQDFEVVDDLGLAGLAQLVPIRIYAADPARSLPVGRSGRSAIGGERFAATAEPFGQPAGQHRDLRLQRRRDADRLRSFSRAEAPARSPTSTAARGRSRGAIRCNSTGRSPSRRRCRGNVARFAHLPCIGERARAWTVLIPTSGLARSATPARRAEA